MAKGTLGSVLIRKNSPIYVTSLKCNSILSGYELWILHCRISALLDKTFCNYTEVSQYELMFNTSKTYTTVSCLNSIKDSLYCHTFVIEACQLHKRRMTSEESSGKKFSVFEHTYTF